MMTLRKIKERWFITYVKEKKYFIYPKLMQKIQY